MTVNGQNELSYLGVRAKNPPDQVIASRAPVSTAGGDYQYAVGTLWVDQVAGAAYELVTVLGTTGTWVALGGGGVAIATINNQAPVAGNFNMIGTASQITVTPALGSDTFSIPVAFIAPGSIASTTTLTGGTGITATTGNIVASTGNITSTLGSVGAATTVTAGTSITSTLGNITATNGNLVLGTAGNKIVSTSVGTTTAAGANSFGTVTLVGGNATVATTAVTASSIIMLTRQSVGATGANPLGMLSVGTIVAATSFVINANTTANSGTNVATDVSSIGWMIIN